MSWHLATYQASVNAASDTKLNAITAETVMSIQNNDYLMDVDRQILWAYVQGATLKRARFVTPTLNRIFYPRIVPISQGNSNTYAPNIAFFNRNPLQVRAAEELELDVVNGGAEQTYGAIAVSNGGPPAPTGEVYWLRATGTTTLTANVYTTVALTYETTPPYGTYAVVGADCQSATGVFFRLIFTGQQDRPGGVCVTSTANRPHDYFSHEFAFGIWGVFNTNQLPRLEMLATAADTSEEIYLAISRVA